MRLFRDNTDNVLVVYRDGMAWAVGDTVTIHTSAGDKQVTIAGILATTNARMVQAVMDI